MQTLPPSLSLLGSSLTALWDVHIESGQRCFGSLLSVTVKWASISTGIALELYKVRQPQERAHMKVATNQGEKSNIEKREGGKIERNRERDNECL